MKKVQMLILTPILLKQTVLNHSLKTTVFKLFYYIYSNTNNLIQKKNVIYIVVTLLHPTLEKTVTKQQLSKSMQKRIKIII